MSEKITRALALFAGVLCLLAFWFFPESSNEDSLSGATNNGRKKVELSAGESLSWSWTPEADAGEISLRLSGLSKGQELVLRAEAASPAGETVAVLTQPVSELGDQDLLVLKGSFSENVPYALSVSAEGSGSVKLRGEETAEGRFEPSVFWSGKLQTRSGKWLYFGIVLILAALIPVPAGKEDPHRTRKLLLIMGLLGLSAFWFTLKLGKYAYDLNEATVFGWVLHDAAWLCLGIMGKIFFGSRLPVEKQSAIALLLLGILFMFALTPLSPPDEQYHFLHAYRVSNVLLFRENREVGDLPDADFGSYDAHVNTFEGYAQVVRHLATARSPGDGKTFGLPSAATYSVMYLPQAVGLAFGRLLRANALTVFYLGRLFNLLFYLLCVYFAVKLVPEKKALFFGLGILPMAIHQAASYSYDTFTNGMALLWIAMIFRAMRSKKPMTAREYFSLLITGALLAPSKVGYAILGLLLFLIPKQRFVRIKKQAAIWCIIGAAVAMIAVFWLPSTLQGSAVHTIDAERYTFSYILSHPLETLNILIATTEECVDSWLSEAVGKIFSGYSLGIPTYISLAYLCLLYLLAMRKTTDPDASPIAGTHRVLLAVIALSMLMIEGVELVTWTSVSAAQISGIQGRYFIPVLPVLFLATDSSAIRRGSSIADRKLLWGLVFLHALTMDQILVQTLLS